MAARRRANNDEAEPVEARPLAVEVAIEAPLVDPAMGEDLGMPLVGVVDLVLAGRPGPLIVDFKTASRGGQPLEIAHEIQLSAYSYLFRSASLEREAGLEIRSLVKTKVPQVQFHPYPAADERRFRRLFAVIRAYLDDLHSGRFVFRPGLGLLDVRLPRNTLPPVVRLSPYQEGVLSMCLRGLASLFGGSSGGGDRSGGSDRAQVREHQKNQAVGRGWSQHRPIQVKPYHRRRR